MEDQEGRMETFEQLTPQSKKKRKKSKGLTVMIIGRVGKVRSFELSGRSVLWVVIFLILYLPVSIFFFNNYFTIRHKYYEQTEKLAKVQDLLKDAEQELLRANKRYVALLYDSGNSSQNDAEELSDASLGDVAEDTVNDKTEIIASKDEDKAEPENLVDIQDLIIQKEGSFIDVDFKLVNLQTEEDLTLEGYVHVIAESLDIYPPQVWTSPREKLKNGYPINFRKGELFIIKRFKPIHRRIDIIPSTDKPAIIRMLVYNQAGVLILEKEFEVNNET